MAKRKKKTPSNPEPRRKSVGDSLNWEDIFQAIGQPSFLLDTQHKITAANRAAVEITGKTEEDLIGTTCHQLFHKLDHPPKNCPFEKMRKSHRLETVEMEVEALNTFFLVSCTPLFNSNGNLSGAIHIATDIVERKQTEQALQESEKRFRQIAENAQEWIWEVDTNGLYTYASPMVKKILGYTPEDIVGKKHFYDLFHPDDKKNLKKQAFKAFTQKQPFREFINRNIHRNGKQVWLSTAGVPVLDELGNLSGYRGADTDITERKKNEEKVLDYQQQLRSLASELSLSEERQRRKISANLHDHISQALALSMIKLQALQKSTQPVQPDQLDDISSTLKDTIEKIRTLTFDLSSPTLYKFGLEAAIAELIDEQLHNEHGINCKFTNDQKPKPLTDDVRITLFQAVRELLINTIKHAQAKKTGVDIQKLDSSIKITIRDNGIGFVVGRIESLTAKQCSLGLFNIRERLDFLGGNLEIKSKPNQGSVFILTAPLKTKKLLPEDKSDGNKNPLS